jgi:hypothetical protein
VLHLPSVRPLLRPVPDHPRHLGNPRACFLLPGLAVDDLFSRSGSVSGATTTGSTSTPSVSSASSSSSNSSPSASASSFNGNGNGALGTHINGGSVGSIAAAVVGIVAGAVFV